jgi:hypothetical protein
VTVDLIVEVLAQHRTRDVSAHGDDGRQLVGFRYQCGCGGWDGDPFDPMDDDAWLAARAAALRHEAERVAEALADGAPAVAGEVPR